MLSLNRGLVLMICLAVPFARAQAQGLIVPNKAGAIFGAAAGQSVGEITGGLARFGAAKMVFQSAIEQARAQYWDAKNRGLASNALAARYDSLLTQKDQWLMAYALYDDYMRAQSPIQDLVNVFSSVTGPPLDRGVHWYARLAFQGVINNAYTTQGGGLLGTLRMESPRVRAYRERRDVAEYLFRNSHSPLLSGNDTLFMAAYAVMHEQAPTPDSALRHVRRLARTVSRETMHSIADSMRASFRFADVQTESPSKSSYIDFEFELSKGTPAGFARFVIAKRNGISMMLAERIRQARRQRYSAEKIDDLERKMVEAWNAETKCAATRSLSEYWPVSDECVTRGVDDNLVWVHDAWAVIAPDYTDAAARQALGALVAADAGVPLAQADSVASQMLRGFGGAIIGRAALFIFRHAQPGRGIDGPLWSRVGISAGEAMRQLVGGFAVARGDSAALGVAAFAEANREFQLTSFVAAQNSLLELQVRHGADNLARALGEVRALTRSSGNNFLWARGLRSDLGQPATLIVDRVARR